MALLSAFIFGRWRGRAGTSSSAHISSLAVLPLDNIWDDSSQEYFAQGMTEELTTKLAQIAALRVISRTSHSCLSRGRVESDHIAVRIQETAFSRSHNSSAGRSKLYIPIRQRARHRHAEETFGSARCSPRLQPVIEIKAPRAERKAKHLAPWYSGLLSGVQSTIKIVATVSVNARFRPSKL